MESIAELDRPEKWLGGHYELAVELGEPDDQKLEAMAQAVWSAAAAERCFALIDGRHEPIRLSLESVLGYQLHGLVNLPSGERVPCGLTAWRESDVVAEGFYGPDWLAFFVPIGGLDEAGIPTGGYPFGDFEASRAWRAPLDTWLSKIGIGLYSVAPYRLGLVGMEVAGEAYSDRLSGGIPARRPIGYLVPEGGSVHYYPATE